MESDLWEKGGGKMKKFTVISMITSGIMLFLGAILIIIGVTAGGARIIRNFIFDGVGTVMDHLHIGWEVVQQELGVVFPQGFLGDHFTVSYNEAYPVYTIGEFADLQAVSANEVTDIEVYMTAGDLDIMEGSADEIGIEWDGIGRFQYYVEDKTLYVISTEDFGELTISLPEDMEFKTYQLAAVAGNIDVESVKAEETRLYLGACDVTVGQMETDTLKMETGACNLDIIEGTVGNISTVYSASEITYQGDITGDADFTGSAGNLELTLSGDSDQFNYTVNSTLGNIDIPGCNIAGWTKNTSVNNNASKSMSIISSLGSVEVMFSIR